jgi:hypothetical protein
MFLTRLIMSVSIAARICQMAYTCGYLRVTIMLLSDRLRPEPRSQRNSGRVTPKPTKDLCKGRTLTTPTANAIGGKAKGRATYGERMDAAGNEGTRRESDGQGTRPALPPSYTEPGSGASAERHRRTAHTARVRGGAGAPAWVPPDPPLCSELPRTPFGRSSQNSTSTHSGE